MFHNPCVSTKIKSYKDKLDSLLWAYFISLVGRVNGHFHKAPSCY